MSTPEHPYIELSIDELDALHNTLGISIKRVTKKIGDLPDSYRNADSVAAELNHLISIQQKVLAEISATLS